MIESDIFYSILTGFVFLGTLLLGWSILRLIDHGNSNKK